MNLTEFILGYCFAGYMCSAMYPMILLKHEGDRSFIFHALAFVFWPPLALVYIYMFIRGIPSFFCDLGRWIRDDWKNIQWPWDR